MMQTAGQIVGGTPINDDANSGEIVGGTPIHDDANSRRDRWGEHRYTMMQTVGEIVGGTPISSTEQCQRKGVKRASRLVTDYGLLVVVVG